MSSQRNIVRQNSMPWPPSIPHFDDPWFPARFSRGVALDDFSLPYWARRWPSRLGAPVQDYIPEMQVHAPDFGVERQVSEVNNGDDAFSVKLDVSQYKPDEIEVKTVGNEIIIKGTHEERQDEHGFVSRQFTRRYMLPETSKSENVVSKLSKDGFLTIEAPKENAVTGERKIPIQADPAN